MHQEAQLAVQTCPGILPGLVRSQKILRRDLSACLLPFIPMQGIADEMKGKVSVVKIDTDKYPNLASRYGIKVGIPMSTPFNT